MVSLPQQNRYLWVQLVGLAAVPVLLDICLAGLASAREASGYPSAFGFQYWVIAAVGILPPLAMQWLRPFYIFSLPPLALKPSVLTINQRRCLRLLESWQIKALAIVGAGLSLWALAKIYGRSAQVTPLFVPKAGLVSAVVAFFFACLFLQISLSSLRLIFVGPEALKRVQPFEPPAIAASFLILGLRVNKILPIPPEPDLSDLTSVKNPAQANTKRAPATERSAPAVSSPLTEESIPEAPLVAEAVPEAPVTEKKPSQTETRNEPDPETLSETPKDKLIPKESSQVADSERSTLDNASIQSTSIQSTEESQSPEMKREEVTDDFEQN